jgi:hypothetical protein
MTLNEIEKKSAANLLNKAVEIAELQIDRMLVRTEADDTCRKLELDLLRYQVAMISRRIAELAEITG